MARKRGRPALTTTENRATISVRVETQERLSRLSARTGHSMIEIADRLINAALDTAEGES